MNIKLEDKRIKFVLLFILFIIYLSNVVLIFKPSIGIHFYRVVINNYLIFFILTILQPLYILIFGLYLREYMNYERFKKFIYMFVMINLLTAIVSAYFLFVENMNFPNYVYSRYHIYIPHLSRFAFYASLVAISGIYVLLSKKFKFNLFHNWQISNRVFTINNILIFFFVLLVYKVFVYETLPGLYDEYKQQSIARNLTVNFKYRTSDMPQLATKAEFLRNTISPDYTVVIPPQSWDYSDIGNQVLMRYFLFPRRLVSYSKLDNFLKDHVNDSDCKMMILASRSYVDKKIYFPGDIKLKNIDLTVIKADGKIETYKNIKSKEVAEIILNNDTLIGVIKLNKCSQF